MKSKCNLLVIVSTLFCLFTSTSIKYIEENATSDVQNFDTDTALRLTVGENVGGTNYGLDLNLSSVSWTNRTLFEETYMEDYSWRMNYNPTLSSVFNYNTY